MVKYDKNYINTMRFVQPHIVGNKLIISYDNIEELSDSIKVELVNFLRYNVSMHLDCIILNDKCYIYDMWIDGQEGMSFKDRSNIVRGMFKDLENVVIIPMFEIDNGYLVEEYLKKFISEGYNGLIIRGNSPYNEQDNNTWIYNG